MTSAVAKGDFATAAKTYQKRIPLPRILARICEQPCRPHCKRGEAGGAINIGLLERACADQAGFATAQASPRPKRPHRVAVVGAGISGLTAAVELTRKDYPVTLFEAESVLGGRLRSLSPQILPTEVLEDDLASLGKLGVEVRTGVRLFRDITLSSLTVDFDAVYLAIGKGSWPTAPLKADPTTLATDVERVFFGGSARQGDGEYSPMASMSDGCRAAVSIDRLLKEESVSAHRDKEGAYDTRLYTSLEEVEPRPEVTPKDPAAGYAPDEARAEAERCLQCECLECVRVCDYLQHFNEYPGKCIRKVTKNVVSHPGKSLRTHTKVINACSLCGLCGVVCPTDLDMGYVNNQARVAMWDRGYMPPAIHESALQDMLSSNEAPYSFTRHQPGLQSSAYLFFPGCQLAASAPANAENTYRFLTERLEGGVGLSLRCCGAPALWSGNTDLFGSTKMEFLEEWRGLGEPVVIMACPTCELMFKRELPEMTVTSLWEILDSVELPERALKGEGRMLAIHDSCTARFATNVQDSVRSLATRLGYQIEELKFSREKTKCCGYGGLMYRINPALTKKVIDSRIAESPADYLTYCTNCRDFFATEGKPAYHVLDLLFGAEPAGEAARPGLTLTRRRQNRHYLAAKMLHDFWGEALTGEPPYARIRLRIGPEIAAKMERSFILAEDIQRVIYEAEESGNKLLIPAKRHSLAHNHPSIITFWVEYAPVDGEFEVFNAYSHRMKIVEDPNHG
jgi:Fe-S oxidoreductase